MSAKKNLTPSSLSEDSDLPALIAAYHETAAAHKEAEEAYVTMQAAYFDAGFPQRTVINFADGEPLVVGGHGENPGDQIRDEFERLHCQFSPLKSIAPKAWKRVSAALKEAESVNLEYLARLEEEEQKRRDAFGVTAVFDRFLECGLAARDARKAFISYRPKSMDEAKLKAETILNSEIESLEGEALLFVQSFAPASSAKGPKQH